MTEQMAELIYIVLTLFFVGWIIYSLLSYIDKRINDAAFEIKVILDRLEKRLNERENNK